MNVEKLSSLGRFEGKLIYLYIAWTLDFFKGYLHVRNLFAAEFTRRPHAEMLVLNQYYEGLTYFYKVRKQTKAMNVVDIQMIFMNAYARVVRVLWRGTAKFWEKEKWFRIPLIPYMPVIQYMMWEQTFFLLPRSAIAMDIALSIRGVRVPRRDNMMWDEFERIVMASTCLTVLGLAEGKKVLPFVWFFVAVFVAIVGYMIYATWLVTDDLSSYAMTIRRYGSSSFESKGDKYGFNSANVLLLRRGCFDVKYCDAMVTDWIMSWMTGEKVRGLLFIDENFKRLPDRTMDCLIAVELGHRYFGRSKFLLLVQVLRTVALGIFLMVTYDNQTINGWYSFPENDPPDAIMPMLIAYQWIWPFCADFFNYIQALFRWWTVYQADEFACRIVRPVDLIQALNTVAGSSENYPIFSEHYAAWILGCPTIQSRIDNIEKISKKISVVSEMSS